VSLNGAQLAAGEYQINWVSHSPEATVTFVKSKSVAATAEAKWVERNVKYRSNSVLFETQADGSRILTEIRLAGMSRALVFGHPSS
jgi:hypothetical protein